VRFPVFDEYMIPALRGENEQLRELNGTFRAMGLAVLREAGEVVEEYGGTCESVMFGIQAFPVLDDDDDDGAPQYVATTAFALELTDTTPASSAYARTRSSSLDRGCVRSKRSLNSSSRSRCSSESSTQTSSRTLMAMNWSRTAVSRCTEFTGDASCDADDVSE